MTTPIFPSVGEDGKIQDRHLPARLSDAEIAKALGQYRGTGFPNGVVTAPVGSIYTDTAATSGAIRWIKARGTGSTGWEVEYGDTGLRKVDDLYPEFDCTTAGYHGIYMRRIGPTVYIYGSGLYIGDTRDFGPALTTIIGRPQPNYITALGVAATTADPRVTLVSNTTQSSRLNLNVTPSRSDLATSFHAAYSTGAPAWPTSLPGTPD